jgi:hypothetical protein
MSKQPPVSKPIRSHLPADVEAFDSLSELALDLRWSWNHAADEVWRQLDPELWEFTQNPWIVLQTASRDKLRRVSADPAFRKIVDALLRARQVQVGRATRYLLDGNDAANFSAHQGITSERYGGGPDCGKRDLTVTHMTTRRILQIIPSLMSRPVRKNRWAALFRQNRYRAIHAGDFFSG